MRDRCRVSIKIGTSRGLLSNRIHEMYQILRSAALAHFVYFYAHTYNPLSLSLSLSLYVDFFCTLVLHHRKYAILLIHSNLVGQSTLTPREREREIGRASCRERV